MSANSSIARASVEDCQLLVAIGKKSFRESHGHSAPPADIDNYDRKKFNDEACKKELNDAANIYHFIYHDRRPAGYSKIIFNMGLPNIPEKNITKLERLYLLQEFYGLKLGFELLQFNIELSRSNGQHGMWLFVWKENKRAVDFYDKIGFKIIGSHDFKLSETHTNPNHQMFLKW